MSASIFSSQLSDKIRFDITKYHLDNGMTIILNPNPKNSIASYYLGFATGSRHEKIGITGISHMFEHLMFKGTKKYPKIDKTYAENGVTGLNAHTHFDFTGYFASFPEDKLELVLDVESDRMVNLQLSQEDLDQERKAVQEERKLRIENKPTGQLYGETLFNVVFKDHPYRWPIIGYKKDIAGYKLEDLTGWYKTYYSPGNAVLVLSGRFSKSEARRLIKKYMEPLKQRRLPNKARVREARQLQPRSHSLYRSVKTSQALLAWKIPGVESRDFLAFQILSHILGAGESSRLYKKLVRDTKKLQEISSYNIDLLEEGIFIIDYSFSTQEEASIKKQVLEEVKKIQKNLVEKEELEKAKNIYLSSLVHRLKYSSVQSQQLASYEMNSKNYKKLYSDLDSVLNLTKEDIKKLAVKYLDYAQVSYITLKPEAKN